MPNAGTQHFQALSEDWQVLQGLVQPAGTPAETPVAATAMPHITLIMGPEDDLEAFVELFDCAVEAWDRPDSQWVVCLLPLLSGEAQLVDQQLPVMILPDLMWAILQWVGCTPKPHHQSFRLLMLKELGHLFTFTQQL